MTLAELLQKRLRRAAILIISGLVLQALSFIWSHPAAFLLDVMVGGSVMFVGILTYAMAVLHPRPWALGYRLLRLQPPELSDD
jgi:hypothetical protein